MLQIRLTYTCQRCGGSGIASDPEDFGYAALYRRARNLNQGGGPGSSIHVYNRLCAERVAELGLSEYPPEEGTCPRCAGTGEITELLDEQDLVAAVEARDRAVLAAHEHNRQG